jgi:hypothetical protein
MSITLTRTDVSRDLMRDAWRGVNTPHIRYVAVGDDATPTSSGDTKLYSERARKAVTAYTVGGTGELLINFYLSQTDAVGVNIAEIGLFAGVDATDKANTGVMVGRALYSHPGKTNTESITLQIDGLIP